MKEPLSPHIISCHPAKNGHENHLYTPPRFKRPRKIATKGIEAYHNQEHTLFDLSSHKRAREAIEFAFQMRPYNYHVFVVGEERSGRMTSTLAYLKRNIHNFTPPQDWVYLNNFEKPNHPLPFSLPAGTACNLSEKLQELITNTQGVLKKTFNNPHYIRQVDSLSAGFQHEMDQTIFEVREYAKQKGFDVTQTDDGFNIEYQEDVSPSEIDQNVASEIRDKVNRMTLNLQLASHRAQKKTNELKKHTARKSLSTLFQKFKDEFDIYLKNWIESLRNNILENIDLFIVDEEETETTEKIKIPSYLSELYGVNILVDHTNSEHPKVLVESNLTYENLFGSIKYRTSTNGSIETNFTMIRPGALHLANGGILVLRGDSLAKNPDIWEELKSTLRDKKIHIRERYRENSLPLLDAPEPKSIPLDIQVYLIASPYWYFSFFYNDPDFRSYFKIKADIDTDMNMDSDNIHIYRHLIHQNATALTGLPITTNAVNYIMRYSSRWAADQKKLSAKFELIADVLSEAAMISNKKKIHEKDIERAIKMRRERNARLEDRHFNEIKESQIFIDTEGECIGQINALTVINTGDNIFGAPCKISARTYIGEPEVVNIERITEMGGPIHEKGSLILEGFLNGLFAQHFPLSCRASLTFEQSYIDVEGDSASMAELIALLSSLSGIPIRQDVAITGSMNQFGKAQSIGGVHFKIEGFFRACIENGLTGTQGVIIPTTNAQHLTLRDEVLNAIEEQKFFIWTVTSIFEAIEIIMNTSCGIQHLHGNITQDGYPYYKFSKNSIFDKVFKQLKKYHQVSGKEK